ncbi:hypothetical protein [Shewanella algae]|uniref:hypothetical protein n=1 Tax=Shewanella algae TaxID=38313 RepID=UPI003AAC3470
MPSSLWLQGRNASERLERIHEHLQLSYPWVDRIACALYHESTGLLKTFINSIHRGQAIVGYEYPMSDSPVLSQLAAGKLDGHCVEALAASTTQILDIMGRCRDDKAA